MYYETLPINVKLDMSYLFGWCNITKQIKFINAGLHLDVSDLGIVLEYSLNNLNTCTHLHHLHII